MATSKDSMISSFIEAAPPGELPEVINDIKSLTDNDQRVLKTQEPAFQKYNEEQFTTAKLPGGSQGVVISPFNSLGDGRYYDSASKTCFSFDQITQTASSPQPYSPETRHSDLVTSLQDSFSAQSSEHYPTYNIGVYPSEKDDQIALVLVANKYSPNNFWNGRWRSQYLLDPSSGALTGTINVDVHYYEDGNVRMTTSKKVSSSPATAQAVAITRTITALERKYHEDLNRAFSNLSEGVFKSLRRQLPVTRQKVEWEKVGGYRLGQDIGGGRSAAR
ncbi:MAG: F-actin-capping protein subunit alpha [Alyxoria varia]|nr:MAG: F-actin-capping protein subunit alpha [Alyxoria varia]